LTNLEVLSMSENAFPEQDVPGQIQAFSNLVYFACSSCGFKGTIPTWVGSMANLEYIRLDQNALTGTMPTELESLMNLKHLDLSDQMSNGKGLSGGLLDFPFQTQLTELFLQHNNFAGPIPTSLLESINNEELVTIDLRQNALDGTVPTELGDINNLNLYLAGNLIEGLPVELCDKPWNGGETGMHQCDAILCEKGTFNALGRATGDLECIPCAESDSKYFGATLCGQGIEHLALIFLYRYTGGPNWKNDGNWLRDDDHCTWEGIICHEDGEYKGLIKEIRLEDNNMVGSVSWALIWQLEGLEYVNLQKNDIVIPFSMIANAKNLETLILAETKTKSLEYIGGATSLKSLHITNADLQGAIPDELYQLTLLEELFLSHNELTGTLSTFIGQMKKLRDIYLFGNKVAGQLPTELGFLASLQHLSLGENRLTGTIPRQITSLPLLEFLSLQKEEDPAFDGPFAVGGGGLIGTLPALDGLPRMVELYLGYNSFTGTIPEHFLQGINDKSGQLTVDLSFNSLSGTIPKSLADFDDLQILLPGNLIHGIPAEICNKHDWMNGEVGSSCDAILCSPGTFNEFGRRVDSMTPCEECTYPGSAQDYGATSCGSVFADNIDDRSILFELYDATGGSDWTNPADWDNDNVAFCDWFGVTCEPVGDMGQMTVTEISLSGNNLNGMIPSILFHLPELRKLDVRNNHVSIGFNAIHQAENLKELYLDETRVSRLDGIGQATSLTTLHLHNNLFAWHSIPDELFDLTSLTDLNLSDSMFSGTLSSRIGRLTNLKTLDLVGNSLTGQIPSEIGMLASLEELELSNNIFFGTLPDSLSGLISLKALFLDNVKPDSAGISGQLHPFATMPDLRDLHLSENQFTGTIPEDFLADVDDTNSVINVYLDANHIIGTVPSQLSAFNQLNIDLTDNLITGIGQGLCEQSGWLDGSVGRYECDAILCPAGEYNPNGRQTSDENECQPCPGAEDSPYMGVSFCLSIQKQKEKDILKILFEAVGGDNWKDKDGWMDDAFDICDWYGISCREGSTIESILLGSNHLVGTLPTEIFQLPNLKFLWLYSNPIDFSFAGIAQATSLRSLLLDSTKIRSLEGIGAAHSLIDVDVRFNQLTGTIPKEIENLVNLQSFTCSENKFTGTVPEFAALRKLNTLRMSNNRLTGTLPSFSGHPEMKSLDVSENGLVGSIRHDFFETADAQQSVFLDLSENMLTGTVPGELSRFTDITLYLRDNKIEGIDPDLCALEDWNGGDVGIFQCDGILCPSGSYSSSGRASRAGAVCEPCNKNKYFGGSNCGTSSATARFRGSAIGILSVTVLTIIGLLL
jgi:Leucine-rich repeat (LRR) protein